MSVVAVSLKKKDVLRYITTDVFGSARFEAMACSFGGLGADISVMQINPAGMGRFSSSRVAVSFNNSVMSNQTTYNGRESASNHNKFTFFFQAEDGIRDRSRHSC